MLLETLQARDFDLPPKFISFSKDVTKPISVVGNGGSLKKLSTDQIDTINNSRLFRCNWAFKDPGPIKKEYTMYFSQAYGAAAEDVANSERHLVDQLDAYCDANQLLIYRYWIHILYNKHPGCTFATPNRVPVWPTTGIQMLLFASFQLETPSIHIAGVDMYTHNRPTGELTKKQILDYLDKEGKTFSESAEGSAGIAMFKENLCMVTPQVWSSLVQDKRITYHYVEIDTLVTMFCFCHNITINRPVYIYECEVLSKIYDLTYKNLDLLQEYFDITKDTTNKQNIKTCYKMWRMLNDTVKQLFYS